MEQVVHIYILMYITAQNSWGVRVTFHDLHFLVRSGYFFPRISFIVHSSGILRAKRTFMLHPVYDAIRPISASFVS